MTLVLVSKSISQTLRAISIRETTLFLFRIKYSRSWNSLAVSGMFLPSRETSLLSRFMMRSATRRILAGARLVVKAFQKGPDTDQQLLEIERFDDIVIGACLESLDLVFRRIHGGEHDHQDVLIIAADIAGQFVAVQEGQIDVEYGQIVRITVKEFSTGYAIIGHIDLIMLFGQPLSQGFGDFLLIFNQ